MTRSPLLQTATFALALAAASAAQAKEDAPCPNFEVTGEGPDLLLVPGLGSSPDVWDGVLESLSDDYRVHLVHVAGFAGRPANGDPETVVERSKAEIIRHLDCENVSAALYAGHSMGGFMGLSLAAEAPERIERLVVVDALPFFSLIYSPAATAEAVRPQADGFRAHVLSQDDAAFEASQRAGVRSLVKNSDYHAQVVDWSLQSDRATFAHAMHAIMTTDLRPQLASIETPTTVLVAANAFAPRERMEALYGSAYGSLEGANIEMIEDSYHFIMFDQPDAFETQLRAALQAPAGD